MNANTKSTVKAFVSKANAEGYKGTDLEVILAKANALCQTANKAVADKPEEERTADFLTGAFGPTKKALNVYNDAQRLNRIDALLAMGHIEGMKGYLQDQTVKGMTLKVIEDVGVVEPADVLLDAADVVKAFQPTTYDHILDGVAIFADNLAKHAIGDDGAHISRKVLQPSYIAMRDRMSWTKYDSMGDLSRQLTTLVGWIFEGAAPAKMISPDVKFISQSAIIAKSEANKAGILQQRDEKSILTFIVRAVYTRMNNLPYEWQTGELRAYKSGPRSAVENSAMAEAPEKPTKGAKVVSETIKTAKKAKPAAK